MNGWSKQQKALAHIAKGDLGWENPNYRMILQNVAGIRQYAGKVSSSNPTADNAGFERFMAFCEREGFIDKNHGPGYWTLQAAKQKDRMIYRIQAEARRGVDNNLISAEGLAGFVRRMTSTRPIEFGGETDSLEQCDAIDCYKILEGLKKWISRLARERGVSLV